MTAKPPTAKAVKRVITKYEPTFNEIAALCRALADSEDASVRHTTAEIAREAARLFHLLHDLHDMASREKGR